MRHDQYDLNRRDLIAGAINNASLSNTSWRVGTVYDVIPDLALYAQYATAADPVSSLITLSPAQQGFTLATGRQIEIGAKQSFWNNRGEWTVAAYDIVKHNLLEPIPTARRCRSKSASSRRVASSCPARSSSAAAGGLGQWHDAAGALR